MVTGEPKVTASSDDGQTVTIAMESPPYDGPPMPQEQRVRMSLDLSYEVMIIVFAILLHGCMSI